VGTGVITLRAFGVDDIPAATVLEAAHQPAPWSQKVFEDELTAAGRIYLAVGDTELTGYGGVMVVGEEAHITNLFVEPESRGHGIGGRLLVGLIEAAIDSGARNLTLEVRVDNEPARALYASLGLAPVGIRPAYYGDADALILWVHDIDSPEYRHRLDQVEIRDTKYDLGQSHP
jgi:[ribosomal protein S18]-alanine N-acetyltransferase